MHLNFEENMHTRKNPMHIKKTQENQEIRERLLALKTQRQSTLSKRAPSPEREMKVEFYKPYLWDNWVVEIGDNAENRTYGRFSLEASRQLHREERHLNAKIALYLKGSNDKYIKFSNVLHDAPAWSGSALNISNLGRARDLDHLANLDISSPEPEVLEMFDRETLKNFRDSALIIPYTTILKEKPEGFGELMFPQVISLCYKKAGEYSFKKHGMLINPYAMDDENLKYYNVKDSTRVPSACRDPFIFFEDGKYHMLFAARYNKNFFDTLPEATQREHAQHPVKGNIGAFDEERNSAIGYAVSENLMDWQLMKPLVIPGNATQFELPAMIKTDEGYCIMVVVSDGYVGKGDKVEGERELGPRHQYVMGFKTHKALADIGGSNAWISLDSDVGKKTHPLVNTYGLTFRPIENKVVAVAFREEDLTLTDIVEIPKAGFPYNFPNENTHHGWNRSSECVTIIPRPDPMHHSFAKKSIVQC